MDDNLVTHCVFCSTFARLLVHTLPFPVVHSQAPVWLSHIDNLILSNRYFYYSTQHGSVCHLTNAQPKPKNI